MGIFSRFAAEYVFSSQLNFIRALFGFLILLCLQFQGLSLESQRKSYLLLRGAIAETSSVLFFKAIMGNVPLATATTLLFSYPIFATLLSWIFLQVRPFVREIIMVFLAFLGISTILRPGRTLAGGEGWALLAAICSGLGVVLLRWLRTKENTLSIYFYHCLAVMVITTPVGYLICPSPGYFPHGPLFWGLRWLE
jgi:drug/metabolite transporter (DMT)-like permease